MSQPSHRWRDRPVAALAVRGIAFVLPVIAGFLASTAARTLLPAAHSRADAIARGVVLAGLTGAVVFLVDKASRRLLPLVALLRVSVTFPDAPPSRMRLAAKAGSVRELARQVERAKTHGLDTEPIRAAENILVLTAALAKHDRRTRGHSERVRTFTDLIAEELRLDDEDRDRLRWAALLHDIGKLMVPAEILNKPGKPTEEEWAAIHRHPVDGARLAAPLLPWLGEWAEAIAHHHERFDGNGYPHRIEGRDIALAARIVAVADSYEVMTAARAYKKPMTAAAARMELTRCAGTQFDPAMVRAFLSVSIGRLWWQTGPLAWLAQLPFLGWVPRAAERVGAIGGGLVGGGTTAGSVVGAGALVVGGLLHGPGAVARSMPTPERAVVAPAPSTSTTLQGVTSTTAGRHATTSTSSPLVVGDGTTTTTDGSRLGDLFPTTSTTRWQAGDQPQTGSPGLGATTTTTWLPLLAR